MAVIALITGVLGFGTWILYYKGSIMSGKSTTLSFCFGNPDQLDRPLDDEILGLQMKNSVGILALFFIIGEALIYVFISMDLYFYDESMRGILSGSSLQNRKRGNVITLTGQLVCFVTEGTSMVSSLIITNIGNAFVPSTEIPTNLGILIFQAPMLSLALLLTSKELKSHTMDLFKRLSRP